MGLADIQEKQSEERKREKRLVHFTNAATRGFLTSKYVSSKAKATQSLIEYLVKSFLDYLFFDQHKEIRELHEDHILHFMMDFAPRKIELNVENAKTSAGILADFLSFLEDDGHIHNGHEISAMAKKRATAFSRQFPKTARRTTKKKTTTTDKKSTKKTSTKKKFSDADVGRNDPCPCGSGKKFKKCCGKKS